MNIPSAPRHLVRHRDAVASMEINSHGADFDVDSWREKFSHDAEVSALCSRFEGHLTRGDISELGADALSSSGDAGACRRVLVATFMWGYGLSARAYGNYDAVRGDPRLDTVLEQATNALADSDLSRAYRAFSRPRQLPGYREGFFTKFLYFVGHGATHEHRDEDRPHPLILDARVRAAIEFYRRVFGVNWEWPHRYAQRYEYYCSTLHAWGKELDFSPDQIERFLFEGVAFPLTDELLRVAAAASRYLQGAGSGSSLRRTLDALPLAILEALDDLEDLELSQAEGG